MREYYYDKEGASHRLDGPAYVDQLVDGQLVYEWYYSGLITVRSGSRGASAILITHHLHAIFYDHSIDYKTDFDGFYIFMEDIINRIVINVNEDREYKNILLKWLDGHLDDFKQTMTKRAERKKQVKLSESVEKKSPDGRWVNHYYYDKKGEQHRLDGPAELLHRRFGSYNLNWFVDGEYAGSSDVMANYHRPETVDVPSEFYTAMVGSGYSNKTIISVAKKHISMGYVLPDNIKAYLKQDKAFSGIYNEIG